MEVSLAAALVAAGALLEIRGRSPVAAATFGAATLARPEAGLLVLLHVAGAPGPGAAALRAGLAAVVLAPALAFNVATVGHPCPPPPSPSWRAASSAGWSGSPTRGWRSPRARSTTRGNGPASWPPITSRCPRSWPSGSSACGAVVSAGCRGYSCSIRSRRRSWRRIGDRRSRPGGTRSTSRRSPSSWRSPASTTSSNGCRPAGAAGRRARAGGRAPRAAPPAGRRGLRLGRPEHQRHAGPPRPVGGPRHATRRGPRGERRRRRHLLRPPADHRPDGPRDARHRAGPPPRRGRRARLPGARVSGLPGHLPRRGFPRWRPGASCSVRSSACGWPATSWPARTRWWCTRPCGAVAARPRRRAPLGGLETDGGTCFTGARDPRGCPVTRRLILGLGLAVALAGCGDDDEARADRSGGRRDRRGGVGVPRAVRRCLPRPGDGAQHHRDITFDVSLRFQSLDATDKITGTTRANVNNLLPGERRLYNATGFAANESASSRAGTSPASSASRPSSARADARGGRACGAGRSTRTVIAPAPSTGARCCRAVP